MLDELDITPELKGWLEVSTADHVDWRLVGSTFSYSDVLPHRHEKSK